MQKICHIDDINEGDARGFKFAEQSLFAVKKQGNIFLYLNRCPHRGINLEWQPDSFLDFDRNLIQCATHGALFVIESGQCVQGPCLGQSLQAIPFQLQNGEIWAELDDLSIQQHG